MLQNYFITNLLDLQGIKVTKYENFSNSNIIHCSTKPTYPTCSCGGTVTIHDYRQQKVKHVPIGNIHTYIVIKKRRYKCKCCGKIFFENYEFLPKYKRITNLLRYYIIDILRSPISYTEVAKRTNTSTNTVIRAFDDVNYSNKEIPEVLGIDEFKSNTEYGKYSVILTDIENKKLVDIVESRTGEYLKRRILNSKSRKNVKYVVMDMWKPYYELTKIMFPNAKIVIDKYRYVRQIFWAIENVRKRIQKQLYKQYRITMKRSKKLILARYEDLSNEQKCKLHIKLGISEDLEKAWYLKEAFYAVMESKSYEQANEMMQLWFDDVKESGLKEFNLAVKTIKNWYEPILNSFTCEYTNGYTEGKNNKIKVLKRISYGVCNFNRFKQRIMHIT